MEMTRNGSTIHSKNIMEFVNIHQLQNFNQTAIVNILQTYFKVLVVRHPFDRLLSGYKDKYFSVTAPDVRKLVGSRILEEMRPGIDQASIAEGKGVTLLELIKYAVKHDGIGNDHFRQISQLCHPCVINYDYIVKLETQSLDAPFIIKNYLSDKGTYAMKKHHHVTGGAATWKALPSYNSISANDINDLKALFELDMQLFGYSIDYDKNGTMLGHCGMSGEKNDCC